jgi:hypothetical protein
MWQTLGTGIFAALILLAYGGIIAASFFSDAPGATELNLKNWAIRCVAVPATVAAIITGVYALGALVEFLKTLV